MGNDSNDLETQRLQLEKDKLAFEVRRFDAEQAKRQHEATKLEEEIRELRRPWFQKPSYLGPLATITVAIIGGFIAFGTDVFKSNVFALRNERDQLAKNVEGLGSAKATLSAENAQLSNDNLKFRDDGEILRRNVTALDGKAKILLRDNQRLRTEKERLSDEVALAELKTHLRIVQSFGGPYHHLDPTNQSLQSMVSIAERFGGNAPAVAVLQDAYGSTTSQELKVALCLALFKATHKSEWKVRLRQSSISEISGTIHAAQGTLGDSGQYSLYLTLLADDTVFSPEEKVATLKEMYEVIKKQPARSGMPSIDGSPDMLALIVGWDEDAIIAFRDPWFDYLSRLYDRREWEDNYGLGLLGGPRLLSFAPQAFGILLMASMAHSPAFAATVGREIPIGLLSSGDIECPYFPADFPLCRDLVQASKPQSVTESSLLNNGSVLAFPILPYRLAPAFSITQESIPAYQHWVEKNQELVSVWTDPTFKRLRNSRPDVMRRIVRRGWIDVADFEGPQLH